MVPIKTSLLYFLSTLVIAQNADRSDFKVIPEKLNPKRYTKIRNRGLYNENHFLCLASSIVRNVMKTFDPVKSSRNQDLELGLGIETCYSVRASLPGLVKHDQHKVRQSAQVALYYSTGSSESIDKSIDQIELTMNKKLFCKPVYQVIKKGGGGYSRSTTVTLSEDVRDTDTTSYGMGITASYSTPLKGIIGGFSMGGTVERSRTDATMTGVGTSAQFQVTQGTCEPMIYHIAHICQRHKGLLKLYSKNKLKKTIIIKEEPLDRAILMPLNEIGTDYMISVAGCVTRAKTSRRNRTRDTSTHYGLNLIN